MLELVEVLVEMVLLVQVEEAEHREMYSAPGYHADLAGTLSRDLVFVLVARHQSNLEATKESKVTPKLHVEVPYSGTELH